jgi:hypothetical protein
MRADRRILQYLPACARYDPALAWVLRPGAYEVENREQRVQYRISREGLPDDDDVLRAPSLIVT